MSDYLNHPPTLKVEKPIRLHVHEYSAALSQGSALEYWREWAKDNKVWIQPCFNPLGWVWKYNEIVYKSTAYQTIEGAIMEAVSHLVQWMGPTSLPIEFTPSLTDKPGALRCSSPVQEERPSAKVNMPPRNLPLTSIGELVHRLRLDVEGTRPAGALDLQIAADLIEKHLKSHVWIAKGVIGSDPIGETVGFPAISYLATNKEWLEFEGQKYYLPESVALANLQGRNPNGNAYNIDAEPNPNGTFSERMAYATSPAKVKELLLDIPSSGSFNAELKLVLSTYHTMLCAHREKAKTELAPEVKAAIDSLITVIRGNV